MKVMHLADVHLGAVPDSGMPWSEDRKKELWESFERAVELAAREEVKLMLIAGDLFHRQPLKRELKEVNYQFSKIPGTRVVIIAGNHDYIKEASYYRTFLWNENVSFLADEACGSVFFSELNTEVYGMSYHSREIKEDFSSGCNPSHKERINILLAHGGDEKHQPFSLNKLAASAFDYIALGHIHKPQTVAEGKVCYAGALEPVDCNDTGAHGFYMGDISKGRAEMKFYPFAKRTYHHLSCELDEESTNGQLRDYIREQIKELGEDNMYRIRLLGFRSPELELDRSRLMELGRIVDVTDGTRPAYDLEKLLESSGDNIIGRYIRHFLDAEDDSVERKALYAGLGALLEAKERA